MKERGRLSKAGERKDPTITVSAILSRKLDTRGIPGREQART